MTDLPLGANPLVRELAVMRLGKNLIIEVHPTVLVYREKGKKRPLFSRPHAVIVASRDSFDGVKAESEDSPVT